MTQKLDQPKPRSGGVGIPETGNVTLRICFGVSLISDETLVPINCANMRIFFSEEQYPWNYNSKARE